MEMPQVTSPGAGAGSRECAQVSCFFYIGVNWLIAHEREREFVKPVHQRQRECVKPVHVHVKVTNSPAAVMLVLFDEQIIRSLLPSLSLSVFVCVCVCERVC